MTCKFCGGNTKVIDSVPYKSKTYRKRKCDDCGKTFYTVENEVDIFEGRGMISLVKQQRKEKQS